MIEWSAASGQTKARINGNVVAMWQESNDSVSLEGLKQAASVTQMLDVLLAEGIDKAPNFCICHVTDDTVVTYVRGDFTVRIEKGFGDAQQITGQSARTWIESKTEGATAIFMHAGAAGSVGKADFLAEGFFESITDGSYQLSYLACEKLGDQSSMFTRDLSGLRNANFPDEIFEPQIDPTTAQSTQESPKNRYDDLFGATINFSVERAAVREDDDEVADDFLGLMLTDGRVFELNKTTLIGRRPKSQSSEEDVQLIELDDTDNKLSRTHARVTVAEGTVYIEDLGSTNGSLLVKADSTKVILANREPHDVQAGDIVDLGGGQIITFVEST